MSLKSPELRDITEISHELILHELKGKKFTAILSFVYGRTTIRYCAYRENLCVCALVSKEEAWTSYLAIGDQTDYIDPQLN